MEIVPRRLRRPRLAPKCETLRGGEDDGPSRMSVWTTASGQRCELGKEGPMSFLWRCARNPWAFHTYSRSRTYEGRGRQSRRSRSSVLRAPERSDSRVVDLLRPLDSGRDSLGNTCDLEAAGAHRSDGGSPEKSRSRCDLEAAGAHRSDGGSPEKSRSRRESDEGDHGPS